MSNSVYRVLRGGSYVNVARVSRVNRRYGYSPKLQFWYLGFRVVIRNKT